MGFAEMNVGCYLKEISAGMKEFASQKHFTSTNKARWNLTFIFDRLHKFLRPPNY